MCSKNKKRGFKIETSAMCETGVLCMIFRKSKASILKRLLSLAGMFLLGSAFSLVFIIFFGYFIYVPREKVRHFPLPESLYLEEVSCAYEPEPFTKEEAQMLLESLKNAAPKNLLRRAASPPHPFFSENTETPFYAVKAVVPFCFSYFIFDEFGNLMGVDLPKKDAESVRRIIMEVGARQGNGEPSLFEGKKDARNR